MDRILLSGNVAEAGVHGRFLGR